MRLPIKSLVLAAAVVAGATAAALTARPIEASVQSTGRHQACYNEVAVRERPVNSPARDNLRKGQTFVVTKVVGGNYVYGYKLVNGVHGWVLRSSIDKSCR
jgi:hypothetical protein